MFKRDVPREPRKPKPGLGPKPIAPLDKREDGRREAIARRLRGLRDIGPGSGSSSVWIASIRRRLGGGAGGVEEPGGDEGDPDWQTTRARIIAGVVVAVTAAFIYFVLVPVAPCSFPGGDSCPPGDDAIALVPDDALAYAHLDIDRETDQVEAATDLAGRVPLLSRLVVGGLSQLAGVRVDFESQVEPWAGGEMAVALLPAGASVERVVMIAAADTGAAEDFASELFGPKQSTDDAGGADVSVGRRGSAWAIEDGFLVVGRERAVTDLLDADADARLPGSDGTAVLDRLPDDRLAYAYLSAAGARALLGLRGLEPLDTFIDAGATTGAAAALTAGDDGIHLTLQSDLDPDREESSPSFFAALPTFTPSLTADIAPGSLAYLGLGDPAASVDALLDQAKSTSPDLVAAFRRASRDLEQDAGVNIGKDLVPLLGSEIALSVQPVAAAATDPTAPGVVADASTPYVSLIADGVDEAAASRALAELQEPVAKALAPPENGRVAVFETIQVAGVQAESLAVSRALDLTYAIYDDRLVIATDSLGIESARSIDDGLDTSPAFQQATEEMPDSVSLLAYFNLVGLLSLGEQVGFAVDPTYTTYAPDLRSLTAAALSVDGGDDQIRTDLQIVIGPRQEPQIDAPPLGGE
jgi:hypothetical protein